MQKAPTLSVVNQQEDKGEDGDLQKESERFNKKRKRLNTNDNDLNQQLNVKSQVKRRKLLEKKDEISRSNAILTSKKSGKEKVDYLTSFMFRDEENGPGDAEDDITRIGGQANAVLLEIPLDDFLPKRAPTEPQQDRESMMEVESKSLVAISVPNTLSKKFSKQKVTSGPETITNFEVGFKQPTPLQMEWLNKVAVEAAEEEKEQKIGDTVFNANVKPLPLQATPKKKARGRPKKTTPKESPQSVMALTKSMPSIQSTPISTYKSTPKSMSTPKYKSTTMPSLQLASVESVSGPVTPTLNVVTPKSTPRNKKK